MAIIKQLTDLFKTTKVYPITTTKAVYHNDTERLDAKINEMSAAIETLNAKISKLESSLSSK